MVLEASKLKLETDIRSIKIEIGIRNINSLCNNISIIHQNLL